MLPSPRPQADQAPKAKGRKALPLRRANPSGSDSRRSPLHPSSWVLLASMDIAFNKNCSDTDTTHAVPNDTVFCTTIGNRAAQLYPRFLRFVTRTIKIFFGPASREIPDLKHPLPPVRTLCESVSIGAPRVFSTLIPTYSPLKNPVDKPSWPHGDAV